MVIRVAVLLSAYPAIRPSAVSGQCPDGSAPPCRASHPGVAPRANSVAVLYFDNLSPDTTDFYLADGLTEELIARLGQIIRLTVKSRAAVAHYRRMPGDRLAYGRALGVAHFVDGSVRRAGNRLRVTVELVRVADGSRVWGDSYDRGATDLLSIEDDIAPRVATAIAGELLPAEQARLVQSPTRNPAAYEHLLRGNYYLGQRTSTATSRALKEYEISFRLDPNFTRAVARIAFTYALLLDWGWSDPDAPAESLFARGLTAANNALMRDSNSSDGWMARGLLLTFEHPRTYEGVRQAFGRALALDPDNAEAWHWYGGKLMDLDDDSAANVLQRALSIEVDRPITLVILARLYLQKRQLGEAQRWADSALKLDPGFGFGYALRAMVDYHLEAKDALTTDAETAVRLLGDSVIGQAVMVLAAVQEGDTTRARTRAEQMRSRLLRAGHPSASQGMFVGVALVAMGDQRAALDILEAVSPRGAGLWSRMHVPGFDPLRGNLRFVRLLEEARP
jgi:TolB-like protein